ESLNTDKFFIPLINEVLLDRRQTAIRHIDWYFLLLGKALQFGEHSPIARLCPGLDGALLKALFLIRDHQIEIKIYRVPKTLTVPASSERAVKGKEARFRFLIRNTAFAALELFTEIESVSWFGIGDQPLVSGNLLQPGI